MHIYRINKMESNTDLNKNNIFNLNQKLGLNDNICQKILNENKIKRLDLASISKPNKICDNKNPNLSSKKSDVCSKDDSENKAELVSSEQEVIFNMKSYPYDDRGISII